MGCAASLLLDRDDDEVMSHLISREIDKSIKQAKSQAHGSVKLLLLGAGESGKSTVLKQMRILHGTGFTNKERRVYAHVIWCDAIQSMKILLSRANGLGIALDCDKNLRLQMYRDLVSCVGPDDFDDDSQNVLGDFVVDYNNTVPDEDLLDLAAHDDKLQEMSPRSEPTPHMSVADFDFSDVTVWSDPTTSPGLRHNVAKAIHELWTHDQGVRACFQRANEFQLEVNAKYYFDNIFKYCEPELLATDEDILKGRIKTTGISETVFHVQHLDFRMFDVGGQRSERRKWYHCFDDVSAVLYVAAMSEYDQVLAEDVTTNRVKEALNLFEKIVTSKWFYNTPIMLLLNKTDLLANKLAHSSFRHHFPDFEGDEHSPEAVSAYFRQEFKKRDQNKSRPLYFRETCATDTESMRFVIAAVTDTLFRENLILSGMF